MKKYGLKPSVVQTIPDEEIVEVIYEYAHFCIGNKSYQEGALNLLSQPAQAVFLIRSLEEEVHNGGFDHYFFNSAGYFLYETIDFLEKVKAYNVQILTRKVLAMLKNLVDIRT